MDVRFGKLPHRFTSNSMCAACNQGNAVGFAHASVPVERRGAAAPTALHKGAASAATRSAECGQHRLGERRGGGGVLTTDQVSIPNDVRAPVRSFLVDCAMLA